MVIELQEVNCVRIAYHESLGGRSHCEESPELIRDAVRHGWSRIPGARCDGLASSPESMHTARGGVPATAIFGVQKSAR